MVTTNPCWLTGWNWTMHSTRCNRDLFDVGVPVLRRRHEPGADWRRDPRDVPQGALPRYVDVSPSARARAAPARTTHRAPKSPRATTREPTSRLPQTSPRSTPPHLRGRPLPCPGYPGLPHAPNPSSTDRPPDKKNVWKSFLSNRSDSC